MSISKRLQEADEKAKSLLVEIMPLLNDIELEAVQDVVSEVEKRIDAEIARSDRRNGTDRRSGADRRNGLNGRMVH